MDILLQQLVSGFLSGSLYALVAVGLVVIYKATDVVNFAHGEMVVLGAYVGYLAYVDWGLSYPLAFVAGLLAGAVAGMVSDRLFYRRLIDTSAVSVVMATVAISIIIRSGMRLLFGSFSLAMPPLFAFDALALGPVRISPQAVAVCGIAFLLIALFVPLFRFTLLGKMMRATQQNRAAAALVGIRVNGIFTLTWGIGSAIGAATGVLLAPLVGVNPDIGWIVIKAFAAAVLGGMTSIGGAVVGGLTLGVIENLAGGYVSSALKDLVAFLLLVLVLVIRPSGLFGGAVERRA
jgi:branched-chain amino acid transport system permease protein